MIAAQPSFVLVRPQMGENIGASARAMLNFGLSAMRIVDPRDGWPNPRAVAMASGAAGRVLDHAGLFSVIGDAVADCHYVLATTARPRELIKPVLSPEAAMAHARALTAAGQRVAILFGPERAGLENDEVVGANALISIPVNPDFPSLNLAQAVMVCAYEWGRQSPGNACEGTALLRHDLASRIEIDRLGDHFEQELSNVGYFFPAQRAATMKRNLRNLWSRLELTRADVQTFHGLLRQIIRHRDGG